MDTGSPRHNSCCMLKLKLILEVSKRKTKEIFFLLIGLYDKKCKCSIRLYKNVMFEYAFKIPMLQFNPVHPAIQVHVPSVGLHVLQFGKQVLKQFLP